MFDGFFSFLDRLSCNWQNSILAVGERLAAWFTDGGIGTAIFAIYFAVMATILIIDFIGDGDFITLFTSLTKQILIMGVLWFALKDWGSFQQMGLQFQEKFAGIVLSVPAGRPYPADCSGAMPLDGVSQVLSKAADKMDEAFKKRLEIHKKNTRTIPNEPTNIGEYPAA